MHVKLCSKTNKQDEPSTILNSEILSAQQLNPTLLKTPEAWWIAIHFVYSNWQHWWRSGRVLVWNTKRTGSIPRWSLCLHDLIIVPIPTCHVPIELLAAAKCKHNVKMSYFSICTWRMDGFCDGVNNNTCYYSNTYPTAKKKGIIYGVKKCMWDPLAVAGRPNGWTDFDKWGVVVGSYFEFTMN